MSVNKLPKNRLYSEILGNDTFKNFGMVAVAINNQQNQQLKMVPGAGLEPARSYERGILSPLCLPISPPGQRGILAKIQAGINKNIWRRNPESNRDTRICNPLHSQSAIPPFR
jgi:hypothetical protein